MANLRGFGAFVALGLVLNMGFGGLLRIKPLPSHASVPRGLFVVVPRLGVVEAESSSAFVGVTSAHLVDSLTDETGTGVLVWTLTPTLVTPVIGTPSSGTLTSSTGLPIGTGVSGIATGVATMLPLCAETWLGKDDKPVCGVVSAK